MSGYRKNSIVIDFSVMPVRPKLNIVQDFVFTKMSLDMSLVKNLQTSITKSQVIIEMDSAATAENIVTQHNMKHSVEHNSQLYPIPVHPADNAIEVKVHDLPPHMPNNLIAAQFSAYGKILSVRNDAWKDYFPGIPNGVRIIRMEIQTPIPSYVPVSGELSYVLYSGQIKSCRYCARKIHIGKSCSAARKEASPNSGEQPTLAEIVSNNHSNENEPDVVDVTSELDEDSEEDDISTEVEPAVVEDGNTEPHKPEEVQTLAEPIASTSTAPMAGDMDVDADPLGGRKRPLSPKPVEKESPKSHRKSKSKRKSSK